MMNKYIPSKPVSQWPAHPSYFSPNSNPYHQPVKNIFSITPKAKQTSLQVPAKKSSRTTKSDVGAVIRGEVLSNPQKSGKAHVKKPEFNRAESLIKGEKTIPDVQAKRTRRSKEDCLNHSYNQKEIKTYTPKRRTSKKIENITQKVHKDEIGF